MTNPGLPPEIPQLNRKKAPVVTPELSYYSYEGEIVSSSTIKIHITGKICPNCVRIINKKIKSYKNLNQDKTQA